MLLTPTILVCVTGLLTADCTPETAVDVWQAEPTALPAQCLQNGQTAAAQYPPRLLAGHYVKVICTRRKGTE